MKSIIDYMDELANKYGSYYAVAKELGITQASISVIRKGGGVKDETAFRMANLLGIDELEVMLAAAASRSEGKIKEKWINASKRLGIAASIALTVVILGGNPVYQSFVNNIHYAKSKRRRRGFCVRTISIIMESIKWHVKKAVFTIPVPRYA